jgi:hypothetical protein
MYLVLKRKNLNQFWNLFAFVDGEGNKFRALGIIEKWDGIPQEIFGRNLKFWNLEVET